MLPDKPHTHTQTRAQDTILRNATLNFGAKRKSSVYTLCYSYNSASLPFDGFFFGHNLMHGHGFECTCALTRAYFSSFSMFSSSSHSFSFFFFIPFHSACSAADGTFKQHLFVVLSPSRTHTDAMPSIHPSTLIYNSVFSPLLRLLLDTDFLAKILLRRPNDIFCTRVCVCVRQTTHTTFFAI